MMKVKKGKKAGKSLTRRSNKANPGMSDKEISMNTKATKVGKALRVLKNSAPSIAGAIAGGLTSSVLESKRENPSRTANALVSGAGGAIGGGIGRIVEESLRKKEPSGKQLTRRSKKAKKRGAKIRKRMGWDQ